MLFLIGLQLWGQQIIYIYICIIFYRHSVLLHYFSKLNPWWERKTEDGPETETSSGSSSSSWEAVDSNLKLLYKEWRDTAGREEEGRYLTTITHTHTQSYKPMWCVCVWEVFNFETQLNFQVVKHLISFKTNCRLLFFSSCAAGKQSFKKTTKNRQRFSAVALIRNFPMLPQFVSRDCEAASSAAESHPVKQTN